MHLIKISGLLTAEKVWHKRIDNFDNCQFQGSLVQRGSWEGRQVFGSSLSCSSSPHLRVVEAKHLWNGQHERRKNGKTSDCGSRLCFEVTKMWLFRKFHLNFALYLPWLVHLFRSCSWRRRLKMLMRLSCCHFVFSESLNFNYLFGTEPHVHETFQRDNDDDVHGWWLKRDSGLDEAQLYGYHHRRWLTSSALRFEMTDKLRIEMRWDDWQAEQDQRLDLEFSSASPLQDLYLSGRG